MDNLMEEGGDGGGAVVVNNDDHEGVVVVVGATHQQQHQPQSIQPLTITRTSVRVDNSTPPQNTSDDAAPAAAGNTSNNISSRYRLGIGIVVLVSVDLIWVASSELTEHIFHDENFDKPFFSTYVKTSMFLIFLFGFLVWPPWHDRCFRNRNQRQHRYTLLQSDHRIDDSVINADVEEDLIPEDDSDEDDDDDLQSSLSPSFYVPLNYDPSSSGGVSPGPDESGSEADIILSNNNPMMNGPPNNHHHQQQRSKHQVKFSKLAEVRQMSEKDASDAVFARMSYHASVQAEERANRIANRLPPGDTARLALTFCMMWFLANYTYQLGLSHTQVGVVNVLSSASSLFTLVLAAIFPSVPNDTFTLSKLVAVLVSFAGVAVVSLTDLKMEGGGEEADGVPRGAIFSLASAFFYATYLVFLRKRVDHEDKLDIPLFFGFVGLFNLLLLWPLFFVIHYMGMETFEWPTHRQWVFLIINGIVGTVFSEVLWLWGSFLTSSLLATLAISLTIPLSMLADVLMKGVTYSPTFYLGSLPMVFSFFAVTALSHYHNWDPILQCCKLTLFKKYARCSTEASPAAAPPPAGQQRQRVLLVDHGDQEEEGLSLLGGEETPDHCQEDDVIIHDVSNGVVVSKSDVVVQLT